MSEGPQYTACIDKANWKSAIAWVGVADIAAAIGAVVALLAGLPLVGLIAAFAAGTEIIRKAAEWQLNVKLICLSNVKRRVFDDPIPNAFAYSAPFWISKRSAKTRAASRTSTATLASTCSSRLF